MLRSNQACVGNEWHFHLWPRGSREGPQERRPFRCRSWRCPQCSRWKGAEDFMRVRTAIESHSPHWVLLTLTFDPSDWVDWWDQYKFGGLCWSWLRKRFEREYPGFRYIQTWERHKKGKLHVNVLIHSESLDEEVADNWRLWRRCWLKPHALDCKFGPICYVKRATSDYSRLAGYLTKLANELTGAAGKSQIPFDAPPHFRRLRASQKTLPVKIKGNLTGRLVQCSIEDWLVASEGLVRENLEADPV